MIEDLKNALPDYAKDLKLNLSSVIAAPNLTAQQVDHTQQVYEYACHEGNHAMRNILSAARAAEQK